jgi:hypothetical protein
MYTLNSKKIKSMTGKSILVNCICIYLNCKIFQWIPKEIDINKCICILHT